MEFKKCVEAYKKRKAPELSHIKEQAKVVCDAIVQNVQKQLAEKDDTDTTFWISLTGELADTASDYYVRPFVVDCLRKNYGIEWTDFGHKSSLYSFGFEVYVSSIYD